MTDNPYKMHSKVFVRGRIKAETGMHIGGNSIGMAIGGADKVVIRNPVTNEPYIPGSSLRGKMRALLERARGDENASEGNEGGFYYDGKNAQPGRKSNTLLGKLFGVSAGDESENEMTRLMVRDAMLSEDARTMLANAPNTDMPMTEIKTEVNIDRITAQATPRQFERLPAGAEFKFEFIITLLEKDVQEGKKGALLNLVAESMGFVQEDSLGGHGSRGYGKVSFALDTVQEKTAEAYKNLEQPSDLPEHPFSAFQKQT